MNFCVFQWSHLESEGTYTLKLFIGHFRVISLLKLIFEHYCALFLCTSYIILPQLHSLESLNYVYVILGVKLGR